MLKHLDAELLGMLESTVPPVELAAVSSFRSAIQKFGKQAGYSPRSGVQGGSVKAQKVSSFHVSETIW